MGRFRIGVDVGGTNTDLVMVDLDSGEMLTAKAPSNPSQPKEAILHELDALDVQMSDVEYFAHGTTVGTNALITRDLPRAALICTKGFRDTLEIGRGPRPDPWDHYLDIAPPYIARRDRFAVTERLGYDGAVIIPLDEADVALVADELREKEIETVAVCLLHSYVSDAHEQRVGAILREALPGAAISLSSEILCEMFEFERTSTTVINACLRPVIQRSIGELDDELRSRGYRGDVLVLHSGGGMMQAEHASKFAARIAKSGPAAGAAAMAEIARRAGIINAIGLDVGGTSSDISIMVDGQLRQANETSVEYGYPIMFPSVDVVTIGAGGGSIAWIDDGGSLRNGPKSQGAEPGPACYMRGGTEATNTDAQLLLGRLSAQGLLGGRMAVSVEAAHDAIERRIGDRLGMKPLQAAAAIVRVANANMAGALRLVSVKRGYDPRDFALVAFGGAGPLHAAEVADDLGITRIVVPAWPGLTSALGCLVSEVRHDLSRTFLAPASELEGEELERAFADLEEEAARRLATEGFSREQVGLERLVDMRYLGQWRSLTVSCGSPSDAEQSDVRDKFHAEHERMYAYSSPERPAEIYNLRVVGRGIVPQPTMRAPAPVNGAPTARVTRQVFFEDADGLVEVPVIARTSLGAGAHMSGPMVISQMDSTTLLPPCWAADVASDGTGTLILTKQ